jgi:tRNA nucleotidyltransferase (CCA-adding enzyme)
MKSLQGVVATVRKLVEPSRAEKERLKTLAAGLLSKTRKQASRHAAIHDVILGGSYAKGTWLPGDVDIDIFIRMAPETTERAFERLGLSVGARATSGYPRGKKYAQHPYTEATVNGVKVNLVPCYDVTPPNWKSAADRSPYHLRLVEGLPERQKFQIRLLKKFMKSVGVYGAEIEFQGFSGYAAEVLVMAHDDFEGVLRFFAEFKPQSPEEFFHLPDPVDEGRDLARAISLEKLGRMVLASRAFLRNPSQSYFSGPKKTGKQSVQEEVISVIFTHGKLSEDTLWGELKRTLRHLESHIEAKGFKIARAIAVSNGTDSSAFLFIPEFSTLPGIEQRVGPSVDRKAETEQFISLNRRRAKLIWVGDDARVKLLQDRSQTELTDLLDDTIKGGLRRVGASREIAAGIARNGRVVTGARLHRLESANQWLRKGMEEIASDTIGTGPR